MGAAIPLALIDPVKTPPSSFGKRGRFWDLPLHLDQVVKPMHSTVAAVVVECPYANMHWHSVIISMISLRNDVPGLPPAHVSLPGATHEIALQSLDPAHPRERLVRGEEVGHTIKVIFTGQMIYPGDDHAREVLLATAQDVADATLNPDKDYLKWWAHRFGTSNLKPGWDKFSDQFVIDGKTISVPMRPGPGET